MTRHDNYVLDEWLDNAVREHEEGADTSSLPPAYVVDLILELRHHRAAADEAAWNQQQMAEYEEAEAAFAHAQAHGMKPPPPPQGPIERDTLHLLPMDDGILWATPQGGEIQWDPDTEKWAYTNPARAATTRVGRDELAEILTPDDFPLTYIEHP